MTACRHCAPEPKRTTCSGTKATSSTAGRNISPAAVMSHNMRPRPGRRRRQRAEPLTIFLVIFITILSLSTACTSTGATEIPAQFRRGPQFARLARKGEILLDRRSFTHAAVQRRQGGDLFDTGITTSTESSSTSPESSSPASSSLRDISTYSTTATPLPSTATAPPTSSGSTTASVIAAPASTNVPLPRPFDTSLGSNFTSPDCPNFFNSFLNNSTFTSCLPLSLLLQNSNSFFTASKSLPAITATLTGTCNVVFPTCSSLMSSLATQIKQDSTCGPDYRAQNPLVLQAYTGLLAYPLLYKAGCLQDPSSANTTPPTYCLANAITNASSPSDSYIYYLPLGLSLPGGARPSCSDCLRDTMAVFQQAARDAEQPVAGTYVGAAMQIDLGCGPGFVNETVGVEAGGKGKEGKGMGRVGGWVGVVVGVAVAVGVGVLGGCGGGSSWEG